jgi:leucyl aminopeptidase
MLDIQLTSVADTQATAVGLPVSRPEADGNPTGETNLVDGGEAAAFLRLVGFDGAPGRVELLHKPLSSPDTVIFVGVGDGDEAGWRAAGAGIVRCNTRATKITVDLRLAADQATAVRGFAEGAWLSAYTYGKDEPRPQLTLLVDGDADLEVARAVADRTCLARTLTNTPSLEKTPQWFVDRVREQAEGTAVRVEEWDVDRLKAEGFGGILAVGGGSDREPRMVQVDYAPEGATHHVVLVGKGITFDTGGIDIKPNDAMQLMRKDMGGAAAVVSTVLAAADLRLPVRVTALAPLAENMISGRAWRPGDVVEHYGGITSEVRSTDAEGRVVLGDALAYAVSTFTPDYLIDLATLTGAQRVALGKRIAALFADDDDLAASLASAATQAGERVWRLPLHSDYVSMVTSEIADLYNHADGGGASILAALFLREFTGEYRDRWAHIDMSAPAWSEEPEGELAKGATGWGVRTLVRFLSTLPSDRG